MPFGPLMISVAGTRLTEAEHQLLSHPKIGGVLLFRENFSNKSQLINLISQIRDRNSKMLIAVDNEGGLVQRFNNHEFTKIPSAKSIGDLYQDNPKIALEKSQFYGFKMASENLACGVNFSFAPVLDLHSDKSQIIGKYSRSFHHCPNIALQLQIAFAKGMFNARMPVTGKHFPEHGLCELDSHITMPVDNRSKQAIIDGLLSYKTLIKMGLLDIVMPAHVCYPSIKPNTPAGFAKEIVQDLLRDYLKFEGVIISDCISMGALKGNLSTRVKRALLAGQDLVIVSHQPVNVITDLLDNIPDNSNNSKVRLAKLFEKSKFTQHMLKNIAVNKAFEKNNDFGVTKVNSTVLD